MKLVLKKKMIGMGKTAVTGGWEICGRVVRCESECREEMYMDSVS